MQWFWLGGLDQFYSSDWILLNKNERKSFPTSALLGGTKEAIFRGGLVNPVSSNRDSRPPSPSDTAPGPGAGQAGLSSLEGGTEKTQPEESSTSNIRKYCLIYFQHLGVWHLYKSWSLEPFPTVLIPHLPHWYGRADNRFEPAIEGTSVIFIPSNSKQAYIPWTRTWD